MNKALVIALAVLATIAVAAAFGGEAGYKVAIKHYPVKHGYGIGESVRYDRRVLPHKGYGGYGLGLGYGGYGLGYGGYGLGLGYGGLYGGYGLGLGYGGLAY